MDRNLALEVVRVTEIAALACARIMGRGDEKACDQAAVDAMRRAFNDLRINGTVVIGEGERDEAPMLDIALDPLEGTTLCATGGPNALSVIAIAEKGNFLHAPDTYMKKIAVGPKARGSVDLRLSPTDNLRRVAKALDRQIEDLTVTVLDRPRHEGLIKEIRESGARIKLIGDGDVSAAIATCFE